MDDLPEDEDLLPSAEKEEDPAVAGNWFSKGVHRVRRSLSRLFGAGEDQEHRRTRRASALERQKELRAQARKARELKKAELRQLQKQRQLQQQQAKRAAGTGSVFKRAPDNYDETEASGSPDEETTQCKL